MDNIISVIIPVYNDLESLKKVIPSIKNQNFKDYNVEIIVVDNGSEIDIRTYCQETEGVQYLLEDNYPGSPYSCRNRGIEKAKGEIIVLLDATCVPTQNWIEEGIKCIQTENADIVGGDVQFIFSENPSVAEIVDSLTSVRMEWSIITRQAAYTANLFIKKKWFDINGLFPEGIRSGGDVRWTSNAVKNGASIKFCRKATIMKYTRKRKDLEKKKWRTAIHQTQKWVNDEAKFLLLRHIRAFIKLVLIPPHPARLQLKKKINNRVYKNIKYVFVKAWLLDYKLRILEGFGIIYGGIRYLSSPNK